MCASKEKTTGYTGDCRSLKKEMKDKECGLTWPACPQGADRMQVEHEKSLAETCKLVAK